MDAMSSQGEKPVPRLPLPGEFVRGVGTLVAVVPAREQTKPPPAGDFLFRDVTARGEIRRRGKPLDSLGTNSDIFGLGTSVTSRIEEMRAYCAENEVNPDSEIEVVVVRILEYRRMRPDENKNLYAREFRSFKYLDLGSALAVPPDEEMVVWSSREPDKPVPELPPLPVVVALHSHRWVELGNYSDREKVEQCLDCETERGTPLDDEVLLSATRPGPPPGPIGGGDWALARRIVAFLNDLLVLDREAVSALVAARVSCNAAMADHLTVQVGGAPKDGIGAGGTVGVLGLLNGICGTIPDGPRAGSGPIAAVVEDDASVSRFELTAAPREAADGE